MRAQVECLLNDMKERMSEVLPHINQQHEIAGGYLSNVALPEMLNLIVQRLHNVSHEQVLSLLPLYSPPPKKRK